MNTQTWNAITFDYAKLAWYDKPFMRVRTALPIFLGYIAVGVGLAIALKSSWVFALVVLGDGLFLFYVNPRQHRLRILWHTRQALDTLLEAQKSAN